MKIIPIPTPTDPALEPWVPFPSGDATAHGSITRVNGDSNHSFIFSADGLIAYFSTEPGYVRAYTLSSPFDCDAMTEVYGRSLHSTFSTDPNYGTVTAQRFSRDGSVYYQLYWYQTGKKATLCSWNLTTPWSLGSAYSTNVATWFAFPDNLMGYPHDYLRQFDVSEDGTRLYIYDTELTKAENNPNNRTGILFEYEMTVPHDASTLVEIAPYVLNGHNQSSVLPIYGFTVYTRGHHVDQIMFVDFYISDTHYDGVLVDKYTGDTPFGAIPRAGDYLSLIPHSHVPGYISGGSHYAGTISLEAYSVAEDE